MRRVTSRREPSNLGRSPVAAGVCQLSLVEHALCPLDRSKSLRDGLRHHSSFRYTDRQGERRTAKVRIDCAYGLSSSDEFYLWGLLALTLAKPDPSGDLYATPHYCLRQLGVIDSASKGGRSYVLFRQAIERLSGVNYRCDAFYDPLLKEHRRAAFGLLKYSLPRDPDSSRVWRIAWDPQFFEMARETSGRKWFDLQRYRRLDPATRRLWLLLSKVLWRRETSHRFCVSSLAVETLGFAPSVPIRQLRAKVLRSADVLVEEGVLMPLGDAACRFSKPTSKLFVEFRRGPAMNASTPLSRVESPLRDPLLALGFDDNGVRYVLRSFQEASINRWVDVALMAKETKPATFFKRNPAAYLIDNLKADANAGRTPPDWYVAAQKHERDGPITRPRERASLTRLATPGESAESLVRRLLPR